MLSTRPCVEHTAGPGTKKKHHGRKKRERDKRSELLLGQIFKKCIGDKKNTNGTKKKDMRDKMKIDKRDKKHSGKNDKRDKKWDSTKRASPHALPEQISTFVFASSLHAWQTQQHHWGMLANWAYTQNLLDKWCCQQSRSVESYDRWHSITWQYRSAITMSTQQGHYP